MKYPEEITLSITARIRNVAENPEPGLTKTRQTTVIRADWTDILTLDKVGYDHTIDGVASPQEILQQALRVIKKHEGE